MKEPGYKKNSKKAKDQHMKKKQKKYLQEIDVLQEMEQEEEKLNMQENVKNQGMDFLLEFHWMNRWEIIMEVLKGLNILKQKIIME